jgi:hypothetical protein
MTLVEQVYAVFEDTSSGRPRLENGSGLTVFN